MATASLGRLTLDLVARIAGYTEPLSRAERQTQKSTKAIAESFDIASLAVKGFVAVTGGLSVAGIVAYSEKVINAGNEIERFAKLSNASTGQFQYYAKGAETAGISIEKFADQMKDMQDRIGDFQQTGGGPLADFFINIAPRVGVTIQQFQKLSGPEALQLYYNSLEKAGASQNDMKFYMEAIISDSSLLIPLLQNGGAGFKKWGDAAKNAGAIMSDDMIKSLTNAKQNLQLLDLQWQGIQNTLISGVIPVVEVVADNFDKVEAAAVALAAVIGTRLALSFGLAGYQAAASLVEYTRYQIALARMAGETITLTTVTRGLGGAMLSLVGGPLGLIALGVQVAIAGGTYYAMTRKTEDATDAFDSQGKSISDLVGHYNNLSSAKKKAFAYDAAEDLKKTQQAYDDANAAFYDSAVQIAYVNANSKDALKAVDDLVANFKNGKISATDFADGMSKLGIYTDQQIATSVKFAEKTDSAKTALDNQKKVVDALSGVTDTNRKSQEKLNMALSDQARLLGIMPDKWNTYTQKQREALTNILGDKQRQDYINSNVKAGASREKAEYFADFKTSSGMNLNTALDKDQLRIANMGFSQKNYDLNNDDKKRISGAVAAVVKYSLEDVAKSGGLPAGLITGLIATESAGNINAKSSTGAKGLLQTTQVFRDQYAKILQGEVNNPVRDTQAATQDLIKNYKKYGNWLDAIMAYNGGPAGVDALKAGRISDRVRTKSGYQEIGGIGYLSPAKAKEMQNHGQRVLKYAAGANNSTKVDTSMSMPSQADQLAAMANMLQADQDHQNKELELKKKYYTKEQLLAQDNTDAKKAINSTLTGSARTDALAKQAELYKSQLITLHAQEKEEYNQLHAFETDRITQLKNEYAVKKQLIDADLSKKQPEKDADKATLDRQMQSEIDAVKREEAQQVLSAKQATMDSIEYMKQQYAFERDGIVKDKTLSDEARKDLLAAKDADFQHNLKNAELERDSRILNAKEGLVSEQALLVERYKLERDLLKNTTGISKEEIDIRWAYLELVQQKTLDKAAKDAQKSYQQAYLSAIGFSANQFDVNKQTIADLHKGSNDLRESQLASSKNAQNGLIDELKDKHSNNLLSEQDYQTQLTAIVTKGEQERAQILADAAKREQDIQLVSKQLQLQTELSYGEQIFGSMTDMMKTAFGEQSAAYKAAFAVQKAFAIAQSIIAIQQGIAQAAANPWPANLAAMASVAAATASVISNISSVAANFATGGHVRGAGTETSDSIPAMLSNNEYVLKASAVKQLGVSTLDYINQTGKLPAMRADGGIVGGTKTLDFNAGSALSANLDVQLAQNSQTTQASQPQHLQINNILDPSIVGDFMGTTAGTRVFTNFIRNNRSSIKAIIG
ncbi:hypothetical protein F975_01758 [Acinetobacter sp. ANC 3789]|uniref:transglycosylase SLT domain-containing protein n=1 Tax=Acinetobacter sp. ANC 3789 TaxID=1217714 RepID=UPI0002CE0E4D|nr:transglycosylase SLT domain-containing protein [Acinetobacter sp. ANC 3789]ENU80006.1 hypothetical protein F975_01758 [Acinetobacter sp. ANC 3789]